MQDSHSSALNKLHLCRQLLQNLEHVHSIQRFNGLTFQEVIVEVDQIVLDQGTIDQLARLEEERSLEDRLPKEPQKKLKKISKRPVSDESDEERIQKPVGRLKLRDKIAKSNPHLVQRKRSIPPKNVKKTPSETAKKCPNSATKSTELKSVNLQSSNLPSSYKIPKRSKNDTSPPVANGIKSTTVTETIFIQPKANLDYRSAGDFDLDPEPEVGFMDALIGNMVNPALIKRRAQGKLLHVSPTSDITPDESLALAQAIQSSNPLNLPSSEHFKPPDAELEEATPSVEEDLAEPEVVVPLEDLSLDNSLNGNLNSHDVLDFDEEDSDHDDDRPWKRNSKSTATGEAPSVSKSQNSKNCKPTDVKKSKNSSLFNECPVSPPRPTAQTPQPAPVKTADPQPVGISKPESVKKPPGNSPGSSIPELEDIEGPSRAPRYQFSYQDAHSAVDIKLPSLPSPPLPIRRVAVPSAAPVRSSPPKDRVPPASSKPVMAEPVPIAPPVQSKPIQANIVRQVISPRDPRLRKKSPAGLQLSVQIGDLFSVRHTGRKFDDISYPDMTVSLSLGTVSIPFSPDSNEISKPRDRRPSAKTRVAWCCPPIFFAPPEGEHIENGKGDENKQAQATEGKRSLPDGDSSLASPSKKHRSPTLFEALDALMDSPNIAPKHVFARSGTKCLILKRPAACQVTF